MISYSMKFAKKKRRLKLNFVKRMLLFWTASSGWKLSNRHCTGMYSIIIIIIILNFINSPRLFLNKDVIIMRPQSSREISNTYWHTQTFAKSYIIWTRWIELKIFHKNKFSFTHTETFCVIKINWRPKNFQGPHTNKNKFNFVIYFFRDLALQRILYLVIFIVSECRGTLKVFN